MQLTLEQASSPEWLDLMWSTFFRGRGRGRSLVEHFPWLTDLERSRTWLATIRDDRSQLVAGLALRRHSAQSDTASVGLVCVRADRRGQGLSKRLLTGAIEQAQALGMTRLTLWTGKPVVYLKLGFHARDSALFGWVRNEAFSPASGTGPIRRVPWPNGAERQGHNRGLPPFAVDAYRLIDGLDRAQAIVVDDGSGPIVAEWSGDESDVAQLVRASLPARWRMNSLRGDRLIAELVGAGLEVDLNASCLQMWRTDVDRARNALPPLRVLDRI